MVSATTRTPREFLSFYIKGLAYREAECYSFYVSRTLHLTPRMVTSLSNDFASTTNPRLSGRYAGDLVCVGVRFDVLAESGNKWIQIPWERK